MRKRWEGQRNLRFVILRSLYLQDSPYTLWLGSLVTEKLTQLSAIRKNNTKIDKDTEKIKRLWCLLYKHHGKMSGKGGFT